MEGTKLIVFASVLSVCSCLVAIPDFMHICNLGDPNVVDCIKQSVEILRPQLQHGNAEYNIPSVEPIIINDLIKDTTGPLKLETTSVIAYGGGQFEIIDIKPDFDALKYDIDVNIPTLYIEAKYRVDGKLMMINLRGEGTLHANLTNCRSKSTLIGKQTEKNGETYLEFVDHKMKITVGSGTITLDNLFNGDKTITKMVNDAINDNLQAFLADLMPYVEKALGANFKTTANQIVSPYTYDQLFPK